MRRREAASPSTPDRTGCARCTCGSASWTRWWRRSDARSRAWRASRWSARCCASARAGRELRRAAQRSAARARAAVPHHRLRGRDRDRRPGAPLLYDAEHRKGVPIGEPGGYLQSYAGEMADFEAAVLDGRPWPPDRRPRSASCARRSRWCARPKPGAGRRCGHERRLLRLLGHSTCW